MGAERQHAVGVDVDRLEERLGRRSLGKQEIEGRCWGNQHSELEQGEWNYEQSQPRADKNPGAPHPAEDFGAPAAHTDDPTGPWAKIRDDFVRGLAESVHSEPFLMELEAFCADHAELFLSLNEDGSYGHELKEVFDRFMALVDAQLTTFAEAVGVEPESLASLLEEVLAQQEEAGGCAHADRFMRMLLAALDFEAFVRLEQNVADHLRITAQAASIEEEVEEDEQSAPNTFHRPKSWPVRQWLTYSACDVRGMWSRGAAGPSS